MQSARDYGPVDILVNNAALTYYQPITEMQTNRWVRAFAVNVHGPFMLAKEVLTDMIPRAPGAIVNISSGSAIGPGRGPYADKTVRGGTMYGAVKAALERFTQGLAQEVAQYDGITVAAVSPSRIVPTPGTVYHKLVSGMDDPKRRAADHDGARGAAAGERAGGEGERPRHLQPADPEGIRLDRKRGRSWRGQPGLGVFADLKAPPPRPSPASRERGFNAPSAATDIDPASGCRLKLPRRDELDPEGQAIYDRLANLTGEQPARAARPRRHSAPQPRIIAPFAAAEPLPAVESGLGGRVRELAILVTAREHG